MNFVAFDLETFLITPGNLAPRPVCASFAGDGYSFLTTWKKSKKLITEYLRGPATIAGANIAFDFAIVCAEHPDLTPLVFDKYQRGEVFDVLIAAALDAVAKGCLGKDLLTGGPLRTPEGKIAHRYSLEIVSAMYLGRYDAKKNDAWRLRYGELVDVPIEDWPEEARQYPIDDATNTLDVARRQAEVCENLGMIPKLGISHMTLNARAAFAMHLGSVWGLRTDAARVGALEASVEGRCAEALKLGFRLGFIRDDYTEDGAAVKREVVKAYTIGEPDPCATCAGSGKVPSLKGKSKINCKVCSGTGFEVPDSVPRTATGGVSTSRDTLTESDAEGLVAYAGASEAEKLRDTYLPFLRLGLDAPINVGPNVLVESGRASYNGLIQLLPRDSGVRECIKFREGYVGCSSDFGAFELSSFSEVLLEVVGHSAMADTINASGDPGALHATFGAAMTGIEEGEFKKAVKAKEPKAVAGRQQAKAANFGFGGGMGAAKLVIAKRKEGLRFCEAAGVAPKCGVKKITVYNERQIPPTCEACIEVAKGLKARWVQQWPEVKPYFTWVASHQGVDEGRAAIVSPITGYKRAGLNYSSLANHCFQHLAAYAAKHALWNVTRECYVDTASPLFGSRPLLFAHDEIVAELIEKKAHEAGARLSKVMVDSARELIQRVAVTAEPALMRYLYKKAEPKFDAMGRLIPWEPSIERANKE